MKKKVIAFIEDDTADGGLGMVFRSLAFFFVGCLLCFDTHEQWENSRVHSLCEIQ